MTLLRQDWHPEQPGDPHFHGHPAAPPDPVRLPPLSSFITGPGGATTSSGAPQAASPLGPAGVYQGPRVKASYKESLPVRSKRSHHESSSVISPQLPQSSGHPWRPREYGLESPTFLPASDSSQRTLEEGFGPGQYAYPQKRRTESQVSPVHAQRDSVPRKVAIPFTPEALRGHLGPGKAHGLAGSVGTPVEASPVRSEPASASTIQDPWPQGQIEHELFVRQQPIAARACGAGDRDRRVIDPPPILQLRIHDPTRPKEEGKALLDIPFYVANSSIYDKTGTQDLTDLVENRLHQKRLIGNLAVNPFIGVDENGELGCFFPFPDLSVRTVGEYRLKFTIVRIITGDVGKLGQSFPHRCTIMTDPFTVYSAKDFPGMSASTPLTRRLKDQGCLLSIKKGKSSRGKGKDLSDGSDEDGDEGHRRTSRKRSRVHY